MRLAISDVVEGDNDVFDSKCSSQQASSSDHSPGISPAGRSEPGILPELICFTQKTWENNEAQGLKRAMRAVLCGACEPSSLGHPLAKRCGLLNRKIPLVTVQRQTAVGGGVNHRYAPRAVKSALKRRDRAAWICDADHCRTIVNRMPGNVPTLFESSGKGGRTHAVADSDAVI